MKGVEKGRQRSSKNNMQPYKLRVCLEPASHGKADDFFYGFRLLMGEHYIFFNNNKRGEYILNIFSLPLLKNM